MLESLEQSNIKRMSVEKPENTQEVFDPLLEFSEEEWDKIGSDLIMFERNDAPASAEAAANIKFFNPEFDLERYFNDTVKEHLQIRMTELRDYINSGIATSIHYLDLASLIASCRELGFFDPDTLNMSKEEELKILNSADNFRKEKRWSRFVSLDLNLRKLGIIPPPITATEQNEIKASYFSALKRGDWLSLDANFLRECQTLLPEAGLMLPQEKYDEGIKLLRDRSNVYLYHLALARLLVENRSKSKRYVEPTSQIPEQRNF